MKPTQQLRNLGQSLWLDNITRQLLSTGTLKHYIQELSVTGLTSNPTIFNLAISQSSDYDADIQGKFRSGKSGEESFFELAIDDLQLAAELFRPIYESTNGVDGFVSLEVSPLLANDTGGTVEAAKHLHALANRKNLFIKIPGTKEGLGAIEEVIFAGIPVNVTLLFSREQYAAAAEAYLKGIERRINAGLNPDVASVASVFISRWDVKVKDIAPADLVNKLGIAVGCDIYAGYLDLLNSAQVQRIQNFGGRPQRLLWASTGVKDPAASDTLYVEGLAAPLTINTMPEQTLKALADHGTIRSAMPTGDGSEKDLIRKFVAAGIALDEIASELQIEGARSFAKSWTELLASIKQKASALTSPQPNPSK